MLKNTLIYFITGGVVTAAIVLLESGGQRILSGLAALVPIFTLVAYVFIGERQGSTAVSQHAWLVLVGTIVSWVPYMAAVAILAPKLGTNRAIIIGLGIFFILATTYLLLAEHYRWFR